MRALKSLILDAIVDLLATTFDAVDDFRATETPFNLVFEARL